MDLTAIPIDVWLSQGIFAVLFVWLLFTIRKESKEREDKLYNQIEKQNLVQDKIVSSLERLETNINSMKGGK